MHYSEESSGDSSRFRNLLSLGGSLLGSRQYQSSPELNVAYRPVVLHDKESRLARAINKHIQKVTENALEECLGHLHL